MKISYNWLKQYLNIDEPAVKISEILTDIGLEVEGMEEFQSIKGGLEGLVVGKVLSKEKHPDADKLSKTTVDIGNNTILPIVCGAPNIEAGQTVIVATVGTTLYDGDKEFQIKKSKIRGEASEGMICAEDEIGMGTSHDGIMVLPNNVSAGTLAKDYFKIENDTIFEIGLTPNRADAASHIGVARDLKAFFSLKQECSLTWPNIDDFKKESNAFPIGVTVESTDACPRYTGVSISNVSVTESPTWLKNRLKSIGLEPINNIVDITNYVLHEIGQPLHAFDADKISGRKVIVKCLPEGTKFKTLDNAERLLSNEDLMICDEKGGMCIAGVFGGAESGISENTKNIFLESAYFNPVTVRKTAKQHQLSTDASFRFERGIDPNATLFALKRAALLIKEVAGGEISSDIYDSNPEPVKPFEVTLTLEKIWKVIGKKIPKAEVLRILESLEMQVDETNIDTLHVFVPAYRVDVQRAEDIIEDILRIYGYNNIEIPTQVKSSIIVSDEVNDHALKNKISDLLMGNGFVEMWSNSLSKESYYEGKDNTVKILNALSIDLNTMRQTLLFGGLEAIVHNANRQNPNLRLFEFGRGYFYNSSKDGLKKYSEPQLLSVFLTGSESETTWNVAEKETDFYLLKGYTDIICTKIGINYNSLEFEKYKDENSQGLKYSVNSKEICKIGLVSRKLQKAFDIDNPIFFCEFQWDACLKLSSKEILFEELSKFPEVRRDLSLLIDENVSFQKLRDIAFSIEKNFLKNVSIFDVYKGKGISPGKKSYALTFVLQSEKNTLKDKQIDKIMSNLIQAYKDVGAELRG